MSLPMPHPEDSEPIQAAKAGEGLYVIRVNGRGSFQNASALKQFVESLEGDDPATELVVDLGGCTTMDSTFMGVLAGIGVRQREGGAGRLVIVNLNPHTEKLLRTLGLVRILDVRLRGGTEAVVEEASFENLAEAETSRIERIRMMIEAHRTLIDVDEGNELRFQGVLACLNESVDRERDRPESA